MFKELKLFQKSCYSLVALLTFATLNPNAFVQKFVDVKCSGTFEVLKESFTLRQQSSRQSFWRIKQCQKLRAAQDDDQNDAEEDDEILDINLQDQDWRSFRAKLVMGEQSSSATIESDEEDFDGIGSIFLGSANQERDTSLYEGMTPLDPSQWAYDSGTVIEKGAVILGGVEQDYGFGLRQQYFHKAAILVLDHEESTFTKGIILNRPTDLMLDDDINRGLKWRVWYGGDVQGLTSDNPDFVCLHSLKNDQAVKASTPVMKDIKWTSFENAKRLVRIGAAKTTDFWVFCGYAGWGSGQLMGELERKSWYMVATDSQTLLKELARQAAGADPRDAGLETWTLLMKMIGRSKTANECTGGFDDLMLKEWALQNLLSKEAGGGASSYHPGGGKPVLPSFFPQKRMMDASLGSKIKTGSLLRASANDRSPFLLEDQELHKSIILIIADENSLCIGVILSRPAAKGLDIQITEKNSKRSRKVQIPLRYGGQFAVKGSDPLLWLHCSNSLKDAEVGVPIGARAGIWKCTSNDVITAVGQGLAKPEEFMVVSGVLVWGKEEKESGRGDRRSTTTTTYDQFEVINDSKIQSIWNELSQQEVLSATNLDTNLRIADHAWTKGGEIKTKNGQAKDANGKKAEKANTDVPPIGGLGEGFDEEDDNFVFKSNVKVAKLCDDALRSWVATFLLGEPSRNKS